MKGSDLWGLLFQFRSHLLVSSTDCTWKFCRAPKFSSTWILEYHQHNLLSHLLFYLISKNVSVPSPLCVYMNVSMKNTLWYLRQIAELNTFFLPDCIGSAFNAKGAMQCPNCRKIEKGRWLYASGHRPSADIDMGGWVTSDNYDITSELVSAHIWVNKHLCHTSTNLHFCWFCFMSSRLFSLYYRH